MPIPSIIKTYAACGCCEPVHTFWDYIKTLAKLKKVSVSPWCDGEYMGRQLRGSDIIYHRKPSPNYLGPDQTLDKKGVYEHIRKTLKSAEGCTLEIARRDVYTIHNDISKVRLFVKTIRKTVDRY